MQEMSRLGVHDLSMVSLPGAEGLVCECCSSVDGVCPCYE